MNCKNCNQPLEVGAAFCGNCGQPVNDTPQNTQPQPPVQPQPQQQAQPPAQPTNQSQPTSQPLSPAPNPGPPLSPPPTYPTNTQAPAAASAGNVPAYAAASTTHPGETKAIIGLIAGLLSIPGALIPIVAFVLGITGIVLGSISLRAKKVLAIVAMIFGGIGIVLGIIAFVYNIEHTQSLHDLSVQTSRVSTVCFDVELSNDLHVTNPTGSCIIRAINGSDLTHSTVSYAVSGSSVPSLNSSNLDSSADQITSTLMTNINTAQSIRTYRLDSQRKGGEFAGEPAYYVNVSADDGTHGEVAFVLHDSANGNNAFIIDEFALKDKADLSTLENNWTWK